VVADNIYRSQNATVQHKTISTTREKYYVSPSALTKVTIKHFLICKVWSMARAKNNK
jgi:hypothetical protein